MPSLRLPKFLIIGVLTLLALPCVTFPASRVDDLILTATILGHKTTVIGKGTYYEKYIDGSKVYFYKKSVTFHPNWGKPETLTGKVKDAKNGLLQFGNTSSTNTSAMVNGSYFGMSAFSSWTFYGDLDKSGKLPMVEFDGRRCAVLTLDWLSQGGGSAAYTGYASGGYSNFNSITAEVYVSFDDPPTKNAMTGQTDEAERFALSMKVLEFLRNSTGKVLKWAGQRLSIRHHSHDGSPSDDSKVTIENLDQDLIHRDWPKFDVDIGVLELESTKLKIKGADVLSKRYLIRKAMLGEDPVEFLNLAPTVIAHGSDDPNLMADIAYFLSVPAGPVAKSKLGFDAGMAISAAEIAAKSRALRGQYFPRYVLALANHQVGDAVAAKSNLKLAIRQCTSDERRSDLEGLLSLWDGKPTGSQLKIFQEFARIHIH